MSLKQVRSYFFICSSLFSVVRLMFVMLQKKKKMCSKQATRLLLVYYTFSKQKIYVQTKREPDI